LAARGISTTRHTARHTTNDGTSASTRAWLTPLRDEM
jgi:hypothetical protein